MFHYVILCENYTIKIVSKRFNVTLIQLEKLKYFKF